MATFWGGGQNDIIATNYLTFLDGLAGQTPVEYIRQATANMYMSFPKEQVVLAAELLYKLSLMDWLTYLDQLRLPILQDRFLLSICNLEDFSSLIALILSRTYLQSDKRLPIVLVVENYYAFVDRTLL